MDITFPDPPEIAEVDPQLEGRMGGLHERRLVDPELFDEAANVRQSRFAYADDADLLALDQLDARQIGEQLGNPGGGHPARRAAAKDDDTDRLRSI